MRKKIIGIIIILLLLNLSGCVEEKSDEEKSDEEKSDEEKSDEEKIIGTWQGIAEGAGSATNLSVQITFFQDKTAFLQNTVKGETLGFNCTWEMEGTKVLLSYNGQYTSYDINLLDDNSLMFVETNSGITIYLTKQ